MASPIFVSNASASLSPLIIIRGFQLALLGIYRGLQNPQLYLFADRGKYLTHLVKDTLLIQFIVIVPMISLYFAIKLVSLYTLKDYNPIYENVNYVHHNVVNANFILINLVKVFRSEKDSYDDWVFHKSLEWFSPEYSENFTKIEEANLKQQDNISDAENRNLVFSKMENLGWMSPKSRNSIIRFSKLVFFNCSVYLVSSYNKLLATIFTSALLFQNLVNIFGVSTTLVIVFLCSQISVSYVTTFIIICNESTCLMNELIVDPYFNRMIHFTKRERGQWIRSRQGILFGFGLLFTILIRQYPLVSLIVLTVSKMSLGYLLTKISDKPPTKSSTLIHWTTSQLFWSKKSEFHVLNGEFVNDLGFVAFPGSFLI